MSEAIERADFRAVPVRNPKWPKGMTAGDLLELASKDPLGCPWCYREGDLWDAQTHDGMCPWPFLQASITALVEEAKAKEWIIRIGESLAATQSKEAE